MQSMIITIKNQDNTFKLDIEAPTDIDGCKFMEDIVEGLENVRPGLNYSPIYHGLYLDRLGRFLNNNETLAEAGVRNGDYCTLKVKQA